MEKLIKPPSGFLFLLLALTGIGLSIYLFIRSTNNGVAEGAGVWIGSGIFLLSIFLLAGLTVIYPNQARVCSFFGKYVGTIKNNGMLFVNPFYKKQLISMRAIILKAPN
jgi:hypothetical protein